MFPIEIYGIISQYSDIRTKHLLCRICKLPFDCIWVYKNGLDPKTRPNGMVLARGYNDILTDIRPDIIINPIYVEYKLTSVKYIKCNQMISVFLGSKFPNLTTLIHTPKNKTYVSLAQFHLLKNLKVIYCENLNLTIEDDLTLEECYLEDCNIKAVFLPKKIVTKNLYLKDTTLKSNISIDYQRKINKEDYLDKFSILSL